MQEILAGWFYPCNNKLPSPRDVFMSLKEQKKKSLFERSRLDSRSFCVCVGRAAPVRGLCWRGGLLRGFSRFFDLCLLLISHNLQLCQDTIFLISFFCACMTVCVCVCYLCVCLFQGGFNILDRQPQQQPHQQRGSRFSGNNLRVLK